MWPGSPECPRTARAPMAGSPRVSQRHGSVCSRRSTPFTTRRTSPRGGFSTADPVDRGDRALLHPPVGVGAPERGSGRPGRTSYDLIIHNVVTPEQRRTASIVPAPPSGGRRADHLARAFRRRRGPASCAPRCRSSHRRRTTRAHRPRSDLVDDVQGGRRATSISWASAHPDRLHRRPCQNPFHFSSSRDRHRGYREAHEAAGLPCGRRVLSRGRALPRRGAAAGRRRCWPCPSADRDRGRQRHPSLRVIEAARRAGLRVPRTSRSSETTTSRWRRSSGSPPCANLGGVGPARMDACSISCVAPGRRPAAWSSRPRSWSGAPQARRDDLSSSVALAAAGRSPSPWGRRTPQEEDPLSRHAPPWPCRGSPWPPPRERRRSSRGRPPLRASLRRAARPRGWFTTPTLQGVAHPAQERRTDSRHQCTHQGQQM